jgi:hypothetical protein
MFGNIVFLGFPLINALFPGGEALLYAAVFQVASDSVMWTFGIYILNHHQKNKFKDYLKHFINPNTMAFVIGIIFLFLNIKIPSIIHKPLYDLGHTTIFLSMLYIGAMLSFIKLKHISNIMYNITLTINKLFIFPIILLFLFFIAINYYGLTMSPMAISVLILQCGMPAMATVVILVKNYKGDDVQATINVFISTIVCLVSLPLLWVLICKFILKS